MEKISGSINKLPNYANVRNRIDANYDVSKTIPLREKIMARGLAGKPGSTGSSTNASGIGAASTKFVDPQTKIVYWGSDLREAAGHLIPIQKTTIRSN